MPSRALLFHFVLTCLLAIGLAAQPFQDSSTGNFPKRPEDLAGESKEPVRLPNGKIQQDEILKADHEKSLSDARLLLDLAKSLETDLDRAGAQHVLSLNDIHKTEEIEKLAKRIRSRMKRS